MSSLPASSVETLAGPSLPAEAAAPPGDPAGATLAGGVWSGNFSQSSPVAVSWLWHGYLAG